MLSGTRQRASHVLMTGGMAASGVGPQHRSQASLSACNEKRRPMAASGLQAEHTHTHTHRGAGYNGAEHYAIWTTGTPYVSSRRSSTLEVLVLASGSGCWGLPSPACDSGDSAAVTGAPLCLGDASPPPRLRRRRRRLVGERWTRLMCMSGALARSARRLAWASSMRACLSATWRWGPSEWVSAGEGSRHCHSTISSGADSRSDVSIALNSTGCALMLALNCALCVSCHVRVCVLRWGAFQSVPR